MKKEPRSSPSRRDFLRILAVSGVSLAAGAGVLRNWLRDGRLHRIAETRVALGTRVRLVLLDSDRERAQAMVEGTFAEIDRLEEIFSRYRPTAALARLNREGVLRGAPSELRRVLDEALTLASETGGAFDPTVAPLLDLYRSQGGGGSGSIPPEAVAQARSLIGFRDVRIEGEEVRLNRVGMALTLDGIAKGFVLDQVADYLRAFGGTRVLVEAGGDLAALGRGPDGGEWRVGVLPSSGDEGPLGVLRVAQGEGIATSGGELQRFSVDGSLHHILDPRTGVSPAELRSVTVLARSAALADALSTAIFVLGEEAGRSYLARHEGVEALLVRRDGMEWATPGLTARWG